MSFYKSLQQLWLKIEQKNIVLVSGNINELIDIENKSYQNISINKFDEQENNIIDLTTHVCETAKSLNYNTVKYFSPKKGIVNYLNPNLKVINNNSSSDDDFLESNDDSNIVADLNTFINEVKSEVLRMDEREGPPQKKLFLINSSEILLNKNSNITSIELSTFINSFIEFNRQSSNKYSSNKVKLVIITRVNELVNDLITRNNVEFGSITLLNPDTDERKEFFNKYKSKFNCLKDTTKDIDHKEYQELITLTNDMSFREMLQYAKIDINSNELLFDKLSFSELYKLVNFNKHESEWEKIDLDKMAKIHDTLSKRVIGQQTAVDITKKTLIRSFTGMNGVLHSTDNNRKPKGILFFVGPTGTGKTELAKSISEFVFGDETKIIRFDMSEFSQEHSDQRLIGAPPGYVGYDAGGELTNAVRQKPFSILLFDEIEKAHGKILDKFLQILEDGRLTSAQGEIIDFSETFIIFTSNIGAKDINGLDLKDHKEVHKHFIKKVCEYFNDKLGRPEILNRIGLKNIVPFNFVTDDGIIRKIVYSKLQKLNESLNKNKNINLNYKNDSLERIENKVIELYDKKMGGRGVISTLETFFVDNLSNFIFENYKTISSNIEDKKITNINVSLNNKELVFEIF